MNRCVLPGVRVIALMLVVLSVGVGTADTRAKDAAPNPLPPGYSLSGTGSKQDFDFLAGAWTTHQRRLKARDVGSSEWNDAPSNVHCATAYLAGLATAEESYSPAKSVTGLFLYLFDVQKRQWSLYWIDPKSGNLGTPLVGGFTGTRGDFYGEDVDDGRPVKVRYAWIRIDNDHARWEQAFSYDNRTWETNWTSDFTRAHPAEVCVRKKAA